MTARTSELLAKELDKLGLDQLARRARADEFHDFLSVHEMPITYLVELLGVAAVGARDQMHAAMIAKLRDRVISGDFDADKAESDEWAAGPEGQAAMQELMRGSNDRRK